MKTGAESGRVVVVGAVVVAAAVVAGDVRLWQMFTDEHDKTIERIGAETALIDDAARAVFLDEMQRRLHSAVGHLERIENDELADDEGLVYVADGKQIAPRTLDAMEGATLNGVPLKNGDSAKIYNDIEADRPVHFMSDEVGSLYKLMEDVRSARDADDDVFSARVRAYLELRANTRVGGSTDVVLTLFVVDALLDRVGADPELIRDLLTKGRDVGGVRIASVPGEAMHARKWLTADDADFFRRRVRERFERAGLDHRDFDRAWTAIEQKPIEIPPEALERPVLLPGYVYLEPGDRAGSVRGLRVDEKTMHDFVDADLRKRRLLGSGEQIELALTNDATLVYPALRTPRVAEQLRAADHNLLLKRALLAITSAFAAAAIGAAFLEVARRRRYDALRASFVAAVSHELRTPLASMRLLVESLLVGASDAKSAERLERLGRDVDGLDFLVENILSFSRLERGKLTPKKERAWLSEIALDAVEKCRHEAQSTLIACDVVEDSAVDVDAELVGLVVANLVRNAWQHNPKRARQGASVRVVVATDSVRGLAVVRVVDDGAGIAEVDRERIFAEFERGSRPASRGTGLGLALCRQIARAHDGDVTLASSSHNGSTFVLSLPMPGDSR